MFKQEPYHFSLSKLEAFKSANPVNIVLSGGGEKGVAHIALLEKLETLGIKINAISGTSAGALVGAMYCSGKSPSQILDFFLNTPLFKSSWFNPLNSGIFNSLKYKTYLVDFIKPTFESLEIPLFVAATNMQEGAVYYFNKGELPVAVIASCAVPGIFSPVNVNGELFSDGGIMDNFPVFPFLKSTQPVIGSYVVAPGMIDKNALDNPLKVLNRTKNLMNHATNEPKFFQTELTIVHDINEYTSFDQKHGLQMYERAKLNLQGRRIERLNY